MHVHTALRPDGGEGGACPQGETKNLAACAVRLSLGTRQAPQPLAWYPALTPTLKLKHPQQQGICEVSISTSIKYPTCLQHLGVPPSYVRCQAHHGSGEDEVRGTATTRRTAEGTRSANRAPMTPGSSNRDPMQ